MIITTAPTVEGKKIVEYHGLVCGEAILGANIFKDLFAGIRDIVGGRSAGYEKSLREARDMAINEMMELAKQKGAKGLPNQKIINRYERRGAGSREQGAGSREQGAGSREQGAGKVVLIPKIG